MASENNKRIVKNTIMLYLRLFITMGVALYTSRIVLNVLGVEDFGIYNIVGGIVVLFSFLNTAMSNSTQRFLNYELGRKDNDEVRRIFSMSMTTHISIAVFIILLGETLGLWFVNSQLNIPLERMHAANWTYQFVLLTFSFQIIRVPYNASIIAYERMSFYAYVSIIEVVLKLLSVFLLFYISFDKLILYAVLNCIVVSLSLILYKIYCNKAFTTCYYSYFWDSALYKKLISFSGWNMFSSLASMGTQQGLNILMNIFLGVTINAAMGIANQVSNAMYGFVSNLQAAFNPQIIKSYAADDRKYFMNLIFYSSKLSFYLFLMLSIPVLICTDFILLIWLQNVPEYATSFCRLIIIFMLIKAISSPLWLSVQATGKIRNYQILMGTLTLLVLPLGYIFLRLGLPPESLLFGQILIKLITYFASIVYLRTHILLSTRRYMYEVVLAASLVTLLSLPLPLILNHYMTSFRGLIFTTLAAIVSTSFSVYSVGLLKTEREIVNRFIVNKIRMWNK